jgi:hypothetical protein
MLKSLAVLLFLSVVPQSLLAADMEITPFKTFNQQPTLQVFGLPLESSAAVTPAGRLNVALLQEIANQYRSSGNSSESLTFDGESYRTTLSFRFGFADRFDAGLNIPYVAYSGGMLDHFIIDWHDAFGMPQGGRDTGPIEAVNYSYRKDGRQKLLVDRSSSGLGDISLSGGVQLFNSAEPETRKSVALRADLKLPTGDSDTLHGSGSTDLALSLCGMMNASTGWGTLGLFGSVGGLAMTDGKIIADQHKNFAGFGTLGAGWGPAPWISFKVQLNATTAFYKSSSMDELANPTMMLTTGGALLFPGNYQLDIGVAEDVAVGTAPDIAFHFGLSKLF